MGTFLHEQVKLLQKYKLTIVHVSKFKFKFLGRWFLAAEREILCPVLTYILSFICLFFFVHSCITLFINHSARPCRLLLFSSSNHVDSYRGIAATGKPYQQELSVHGLSAITGLGAREALCFEVHLSHATQPRLTSKKALQWLYAFQLR